MRRISQWLVPLFLVVLGVLLIWDSSLLMADGTSDVALQNSVNCNQPNSTAPHPCPTLAGNTETSLAALTGGLGAVTVLAGVVISVIRWVRTAHVGTRG